MRGPIDYIVVNFSEPKFDGKVIEELQRATGSGAIQVLALSVIKKNEDGSIEALEADDGGVVVASFTPTGTLPIEQDDIDEVGSLLEPGSAAGLLIIEHLWAKGLKQALLDSGGELVAEGRIHPDAARELESTETEE